MMKQYRLSRYTLVADQAGTVLSLYNTRSGKHMLVDLCEVPALRSLLCKTHVDLQTCSQEAISALSEAGFIVPESTDELQELRAARAAALGADYGVRLAILPTLACNFSCAYCFHGGSLDRGAMTNDTEDRLVAFTRRLLTSTSRGPLVVMWFGGEPLLELPRIRRLWRKLTDLALQTGVLVSGSMITNGYLLESLTPGIAKELDLSSVQVTLDGPRDVHDRRRPLAGGGPTFDRILKNLSTVTRYMSSITIRINVDRGNYEATPFLLRELRDLGILDRCRFSVSPVDGKTGVCGPSQCSTYEPGEWAAVLNRIDIDARQLNVQDRMEERYPEPWALACSAQVPNAFVVDPGGLLFKCLNDVAFRERAVYDVVRDVDLNRLRADLLRRSSPFNTKQCQSCLVMPVCNAGCPSANVDGKTSGFSCTPLRFLLRRRLARYTEDFLLRPSHHEDAHSSAGTLS